MPLVWAQSSGTCLSDARASLRSLARSELQKVLPHMKGSLTWTDALCACRHPASGYVQGINDLLTPFLAAFLSEHFRGHMDTWYALASCLPWNIWGGVGNPAVHVGHGSAGTGSCPDGTSEPQLPEKAQSQRRWQSVWAHTCLCSLER